MKQTLSSFAEFALFPILHKVSTYAPVSVIPRPHDSCAYKMHLTEWDLLDALRGVALRGGSHPGAWKSRFLRSELRGCSGDGCEVLAAAEWKRAALPSNLLIDSGVRGPLVDEQPHDLGISLPGCQVQRVTAFGVSHVGQRVIPQKNLDHIPGRQRSVMSLQNPEAFPTNGSLHTCTAQSVAQLVPHLAPCPPKLTPSLFL